MLKFFSISFTVSGAENIARYIEDFVYRGSSYQGSRILICVYFQNWCGHYSERAISFATKFEDHSPKPWRYAILTSFFFLACLNVDSKVQPPLLVPHPHPKHHTDDLNQLQC